MLCYWHNWFRMFKHLPLDRSWFHVEKGACIYILCSFHLCVVLICLPEKGSILRAEGCSLFGLVISAGNSKLITCKKMNGMMKAALRYSSFKNITNPLKQALLPGSTVAGSTKQQFTRTLWHMCSTKSEDSKVASLKLKNPTSLCSCGCGSRRLQHTKSKYSWTFILTWI